MSLTPALGCRRAGIAAAVCCRWSEGELSLGLVSTRDGGRWTFPKGHREARETLWRAAAREALEEAGVIGVVDDRCLLAYSYPARRGGDDLVAAFLLHVTGVGAPAESFRAQVWCDPETARRHLARGRDPFHARELERVLEAAVRAAPSSRERAYASAGPRISWWRRMSSS